MATVAVLLQTGFETVEALQPIDYLRRAGFKLTTVSLEADKTVVSAQKVPVIADTLVSEVDLAGFDCVVLPGGQIDPEKYLAQADALKQLKATGKTLAAICAAPQVFARLGFLDGKEGVIYPTMQAELTAGGCRFLDQPVVVTDNLIMGRSVDAAADFAYKVIEVLADKNKADKVKKQNFYY